MYPPFPQELARYYCKLLVSHIESNKIELEQVAQESVERSGQGVMLGCLVCWDKSAEKRVVLATVSGNAKRLRQISFDNNKPFLFVPNLVTNLQIESALKEYDLQIHELTSEINSNILSEKEKQQLIQKRTSFTDVSLRRVFELYEFTCIGNKKKSLTQIIQNRKKLVPTGTGDCCAPKLLSYAFEKEYEIISMDEIFYGSNTKNKENGKSYPPCDERCGIVLPYMLGLNILYRDSHIIVINKPSMLLSVPGRGEDKQDCAVNRIKKLFPDCIEQPSVHRLDMETSGILIFALTQEAHKNLSIQFENGLVHKKYIALLEGVLEKSEGEAVKGKKLDSRLDSGTIALKFRLDPDNRPHQIYDEENGKLGITEWKRLNTETFVNPVTKVRKVVTRIEFSPKTGRTHQLRLAASHKKGLGLPILGDSLYGKCSEGERLMLHAFEIEFCHPVSGKRMYFNCPAEF